MSWRFKFLPGVFVSLRPPVHHILGCACSRIISSESQTQLTGSMDSNLHAVDLASQRAGLETEGMFRYLQRIGSSKWRSYIPQFHIGMEKVFIQYSYSWIKVWWGNKLFGEGYRARLVTVFRLISGSRVIITRSIRGRQIKWCKSDGGELWAIIWKYKTLQKEELCLSLKQSVDLSKGQDGVKTFPTCTQIRGEGQRIDLLFIESVSINFKYVES